jgi:manganese efflux pump family protein
VDTFTMLITAIALGADAFAVSAAVSAALPVVTFRHTFRLSWHFGLFQSLMTILGWLGGEGIAAYLSGLNCYIAFGFLLVLGAKMIYESRHEEERAAAYDPTRGWSLVALSVATSLDALAVGISFSLLGTPIWIPALVIGSAALLMAFAGTRAGLHGGTVLGKWAETAGGIILICIGVKILGEHLLG